MEMYDLTTFQFDVLAVLRSTGKTHGLGIKDELETHFEYYDNNVHHGRMYPNIDDLVEMGLIEKGKIDDRTNSYELTDWGVEVLNSRVNALEGNYTGESE